MVTCFAIAHHRSPPTRGVPGGVNTVISVLRAATTNAALRSMSSPLGQMFTTTLNPLEAYESASKRDRVRIANKEKIIS